MNPIDSVFLMTVVLATAVALATWRAANRVGVRPVAVETAGPRPRRNYYWYRLPSGMWTWDRVRYNGRIEYGPLFIPDHLPYVMDHRWVIRYERDSGNPPDTYTHSFNDVMCYYVRPRPESAPDHVATPGGIGFS